ncbi:rhamnogalacturonan lyase family protein [Agromyces atrinae]|uniref:Fibronectin type 3 domain-containing protein n=1 Tax=Agromyces atrinae TaxID=592376 RepID=A0A4Q2MCY8_9MICO|nr:hypothetical protein [Agromyces atrinae]NYD67206.1 fibronectin type 3 domain-containing protein [Agromyces atrinae]RXZ86960.1 hypothetical protein ESP50_07815 [Agromyces atrinae]
MRPTPPGRTRSRSRSLFATLTASVVAAALVLVPTAAHADEKVDLAFDFGGPSSPVEPGWIGIAAGSTYSADLGYGFLSGGTSFRDRGGNGSAMLRDFVNGAWEFAVDLPNGTYEVTTWAGDLIAANRTNLTIEGVAFTGPRTNAPDIHEEFFPAVEVSDGQLNIVGAADGRINGIRVQTPLPAPAGLAATVDASGDLSATLTWDAAPDAVEYSVLRSAPGGALTEIGRTASTDYTDDTVGLGESYQYAVATVSAERTSRPSAPIDVQIVDPSLERPAAPTGLVATATERNSVSLAWDDDEDVALWKVFRSTREDIPFEEIALLEEPAFTDASVLTTRPYLYRVVALNGGGTSDESATLATEAVTTLVREAEYLDRSPVAVAVDEGVYLGWRLLGLDDRGLGFDVYRDGAKITDAPITGATNLVDPDGTTESSYLVTAHIGDREVTVTDEFGVWEDQFLDVALDKPADGVTPSGESYTYSPGDASVGDLDGDGEYEIVIIWNPSNTKDNSQSGYTGIVYVDAYKLDGTKLWRIDLGKNIRAGAHYTQLQVFDYDGDGRAEVAFKTADGTVDGTGAVIGDPSADFRNSAGYILSGPEYLTLFEGATGAALDTIEYKPARGNVGSWGDTYGNRVDRFLAGTAYLDGESPSLIVSRGYYTRTVIVAYDIVDGALVERWTFDSNQAGRQYEGQGNHQLSIADVDRDGLDEIVFGALTIDHDGSVLYNTDLKHGDALHVGDFDPARLGLEVFGVHESPGTNGNRIATMRDAETGEVLWANSGSRDTGRGAVAEIDPRHPGSEAWSLSDGGAWNARSGTLKTAAGEELGSTIPAANFVTWWDGDLLREITDHAWDATALTGVPTISKWDWENEREVELFRADGMLSNNGTKGTPVLQADLFGDWREEVVVRHASGDALRILTTTTGTEHRIPTLMHDPTYRLGVAWQNTSYNQPPHPGFHLGVGMEEPPVPSIAYVGAPDEDATAPVIAGLPEGLVNAADGLTLSITADDPESGIRSLDVTFDGEPVSPDAVIDLAGLSGEFEVTATAVNNAGLVAEARSSVLVVPADQATSKPGQGTLSNTSGWANGLHDGNFDVVMNLWWGTPGTLFRLYENGELIETRVLPATAGMSQTTGVTFDGKPNGRYEYTAELVNSKGSTATSSTVVVVNAANPGAPVLSHDNWDGDGAFTVTANLWWGTNATSYRFLLNGAEVGSGDLVARSPGAQRASVELSGIPVGTHTVTAVFANAAGETESAPLTVVVTR